MPMAQQFSWRTFQLQGSSLCHFLFKKFRSTSGYRFCLFIALCAFTNHSMREKKSPSRICLQLCTFLSKKEQSGAVKLMALRGCGTGRILKKIFEPHALKKTCQGTPHSDRARVLKLLRPQALFPRNQLLVRNLFHRGIDSFPQSTLRS